MTAYLSKSAMVFPYLTKETKRCFLSKMTMKSKYSIRKVITIIPITTTAS